MLMYDTDLSTHSPQRPSWANDCTSYHTIDLDLVSKMQAAASGCTTTSPISEDPTAHPEPVWNKAHLLHYVHKVPDQARSTLAHARGKEALDNPVRVPIVRLPEALAWNHHGVRHRDERAVAAGRRLLQLGPLRSLWLPPASPGHLWPRCAKRRADTRSRSASPGRHEQ
jgi:hypothetical protein